MSRQGNPYDNAKAERFMRTLKYEEIYMNDYETLAEVRISIEHFIEAVYNRKRLHLAIGYRPCCMWGALACGSCLMSQAKNSKGSDRRAAEHC